MVPSSMVRIRWFYLVFIFISFFLGSQLLTFLSPSLIRECLRAERGSDYLPHCPSLSSMVVCKKKTPTSVGWMEYCSSHFFCHFCFLLSFSNGPSLISTWYYRDNLARFLFTTWTFPLPIVSSTKLEKLWILYLIFQCLAFYRTSCSAQLPRKLCKRDT